MNEKYLDYIIKHIPELETPRLILRKIKKSDAADMFEYASKEDVTKYLLWNAHESLKYTKKYLKFLVSKYKTGEYLDWGIVLKSNNKLIGTCGFASLDLANAKCEIGYVLNPDYHKNGYAYEAVGKILEYAFDTLGLNRIEARVIKGNEPSISLLKRCGMTEEGEGREEIYVKGEYKSLIHFSLLKGERL
ncbi:MAG: GNAT family N-acetyltransferase [Clostridia bacterium]|nr:GNAT family N-acetyltransferase [Clostridia bacterium]